MNRVLLLVIMISFCLDLYGDAGAAEFEVSGDFRVRGFYTDNLLDASDASDDETAYNSMRFMMRAMATAGIGKGVVELHFASGNNRGNLRFGQKDGAFGPKGGTLALHQAYLQADLLVAILSAGRKNFVLGHGLVLDDPADGFFLDIPIGSSKLTLANLKLFDCSSRTADNPAIGESTPSDCSFGTSDDSDFYVGNLFFRPSPDIRSNFFIGYYSDRRPQFFTAAFLASLPGGVSPTGAHFLMVGASADASLGILSLGGEIDYLWGSTKVSSGPQPDIEGLNVELFGVIEVGPANVGLTLLYASGQDPNKNKININGLDGNYPTGIILSNGGTRALSTKDGTCLSVNGASLGGVPNCALGAGLIAFKWTASVQPMNRLTLQGDMIYARSAEAPSTANSSKEIGLELDGTVQLQLDENFSISTGFGYLISGDFWRTACGCSNPDNQVVGVLELRFIF